MYHITLQLEAIQRYLEENDGLLPEDVEAAEEEAIEALREEGEGVYKFVKNLRAEADLVKAQADILDEEVKRLRSIQSARQNKADRMMDLLTRALLAAGIKKIETPVGNFVRMSGPVTVQVHDLDRLLEIDRLLPLDAEPLTKQTIAPVKAAVRKAIENGIVPEDVASIEDGKPYVRLT